MAVWFQEAQQLVKALFGPHPDLCTSEFFVIGQESNFLSPCYSLRSSILSASQHAQQASQEWTIVHLASVLWNLNRRGKWYISLVPPLSPLVSPFLSLATGQPPFWCRMQTWDPVPTLEAHKWVGVTQNLCNSGRSLWAQGSPVHIASSRYELPSSQQQPKALGLALSELESTVVPRSAQVEWGFSWTIWEIWVIDKGILFCFVSELIKSSSSVKKYIH